MDLEVLELFKELLQFKSITPSDGGAFQFLKEYLKGTGDIFEIEKGGVKNLIAIKEMGPGEHLTLAGHIDVVPPGEGWSSDPFQPVERGGYIYGRGAQDMKSGLTGLIYAFKFGRWRRGTLSLIITSDEEGEAKFGTLEVLKWMEREGLLPHYGIVGEPTSEERFGDTIKIGRRGSINGVLEIYGVQGHVAYPNRFLNPVEILAPLLPAFAGRNLDEGTQFFDPSRIVITDIRGGLQVTNVTPDKVRIMFNVRNSPATTPAEVEEFFKNLLKGVDYSLQLQVSAEPFRTDPSSKVVTLLQREVAQVTKVTPKLSTGGGTSDARFLAQFGVKVAEFGPRNDRAHKVDERVSIDEVLQLGEIFKRVLEGWR